MKIQGEYRGRTYKEVTITLAEDRADIPDAMIIGWAMSEVGETPSTLFGWDVKRPVQYPLMAVVTLYTD
jgi:hypothetical protein